MEAKKLVPEEANEGYINKEDVSKNMEDRVVEVDNEEVEEESDGSFEEDEYDEESTDEDTEYSRRKKSSYLNYFEDAASEGEEDEELEEEEEAEAGFEKVRKELASQPPRKGRFRDFLADENLEKRYSELDVEIPVDEESIGPASRELQQQTLIPSITDPKLWMVRCRPGHERQSVVALMRKYIDLEFSERPLQIKSCFAVDNLKGFIYVEAHKDAHVKAAVEGMAALQFGQWKQTLVPLEQMTDVLTCLTKSESVLPGTWARLKRSLYKDDLAQILAFDENNAKCIIKLVPRLETGNTNDPSSKRTRSRPPPRLFDPEEHARGGLQKKRVLDFYCTVCDNQKFDPDGYLIKTVDLRALVTEGVQPTIEEMRSFSFGDNDEITGLTRRQFMMFKKGDRVKVVEGDLRGLLGVVESVDGSTAYVRPRLESLKGLIPIPCDQMRKHFEQGDHVKVVAGVHKGETGLVTSVADHVVHVIGDHSNEEFEVFPRDISLSRDISSGMRQSGLFKVHDLVDIDTHNVGVILKAEKDIFAILTQNGEVRKVPVKEITTKRKFRNPKALDAQRNELQLEDPVKVIEGPHKNKQGTLKHIYRGACFLYSRDILENSGMFVARNHQVLLVGAKKKSTGHNFEGWGFPHGSSRSFNGHRNAISSSWRGPDPLRNAKVLVTRGTHKGIHGIVKDCTDNTARVELSSTSLMITINRQHLCVLDKSGNIIQSNPKADAASIPPHTARYSDFGSDFSLFNSSYSDVSFASQTPAYGQQTPLHDSEGAGYSSAWDPLNTNTPLQPSTPGLTDLGDSYTPQTVKNNFSSDTPLGPPSTGNPPSTPGCPESSLASYDVPTPGYLPHTPGAYASNLPKDYTFSTPLSFGVSTPANYEPTFGPESSEFPRTPSSVLTPTSDTSRSSWLHPDIVVTIGIGPFKGKRGSVRSVHENRTACSVSLDTAGEFLEFKIQELEPVRPKQKEKMVILEGELSGLAGEVLLIDTQTRECIVKLTNGLERDILLDCLALRA